MRRLCGTGECGHDCHKIGPAPEKLIRKGRKRKLKWVRPKGADGKFTVNLAKRSQKKSS